MANDKLRDLTVVDIVYHDGERPTAQKLEGGEVQTRKALEYLEATIGDAFGESLQLNPVYISNIARDIGDRSMLNPVLMPDIFVDDYVQQLTLGKTEHELDLIPVGSGSGLLSLSNDGSIVIGQFKNSVEELTTVGDWTILPGMNEHGVEKNSRKLITHAPSTGGTIIFTRVTSGRGSTGVNATHNVIPSIAQAKNGGPFLQITELDPLNNIYSFRLPVENQTVNRVYESASSSLSNTRAGVEGGQQIKLPRWLFDPAGLDLGNPNLGQQDIPLNVIRLYDWNAQKVLDGLVRVQTSPSPMQREYEIVCTLVNPLMDLANQKIMLVTTGNSLADFLGAIQRDLYFHTHLGDDMIRGIKHSDLYGLRTGSSNIALRSDFYGPSNIDNNDHSQYLHRCGFTDTDTGAGGNVMRGDLVIGNKNTGPASSHENYNLLEDSYKLAFGEISNGGEIFFDKVLVHNLSEGRGNIPQTFSGESLVIKGAHSSVDTVFVDGNLRIKNNVVLGTDESDDVFVSGDIYVKNSLVLIPRITGGLTPETGMMIHSSTENAPVFWNGQKWINLATGDLAITVGDGITSYGKYNGANATVIQAAINEAAITGGKVYILRGVYNLNSTSLTLADNVKIEGDGEATVINATGTCFSIGSGVSKVQISDVKIQGASVGFSLDGSRIDISNILFSGVSTAINLGVNASDNIFTNNRYLNCLNKIVQTNSDIKTLNTSTDHIGYTTAIYAIDPIDKEKDLYLWKRISGSGSLTYENSTDSMIGRGRWRVFGNGTFEFDKFMPVMPEAGIGGYIGVKATSNVTVSIGFTAYDANLSPLASNGGFILNNESGIPTSWKYEQDICVLEDNNDRGRFPIGTRFIKMRIDISSNAGDFYFDGFNIFPMNFSTISLYS